MVTDLGRVTEQTRAPSGSFAPDNPNNIPRKVL